VARQVEYLTPLEKIFMKMLTHVHKVVYTCWCWHICKGEGVGVDFDQLGEGRKVFRCSPDTRIALGVKYCFDPL
jgi:hypothetical protein